MELKIINPQVKYPPATLVEPAPLGYIHLAALHGPPVRQAQLPTYVLANMLANRTGAMPLLYRLA